VDFDFNYMGAEERAVIWALPASFASPEHG
jgi:hypothetical protein